jgi:hypothetical protein
MPPASISAFTANAACHLLISVEKLKHHCPDCDFDNDHVAASFVR